MNIKKTCGGRQEASCTFYDPQLPEFSKIEEDCVTLEDTTEDTYVLITEIKEEINLENLGGNCLTYSLTEGKIIVKEALLKQETEICELKEQIIAQALLISSMQEAITALQENNCP